MLRRMAEMTVVVLLALLVLPAAAFAQTGSGIAGEVRDTSGAVLPGVTVEASSPALIEKVRSVTTDGQGRYNISDLRLGTYVVTFSLPGFTTIRREGIQLSSGFTATVNIDMSVGGLEETLVVTAESPLVDVQNIRQQVVMTNEVIESIPIQRSMYGVGQLVPGVIVQEGGVRMQDVGGSAGEGARLIVHGSRESDTHWLINGMPFNSFQHASSSHIRANVGEVEEFVLEVGGISAEHRLGGMVMNLVTKAGGNVRSGNIIVNYAGEEFQSDNYSEELRDAGLVSPNRLVRNYDYGGDVGGPIVQDKLWYFAHGRYWGVDELIAGTFYDSNQNDFVYTPDTSRQAHNESWHYAANGRGTWQATQKNRLTSYITIQPSLSFSANPFSATSPEALTARKRWANYYHQHAWTSTVTPRLLLEVGASFNRNYSKFPLNEAVVPDAPTMRERSTGIRFGAPANRSWPQTNNLDAYRATLSFVTGSHSFKVGMMAEYGRQDTRTISGGGAPDAEGNPIGLDFLNGVPSRVVLQATPRWQYRRFGPTLGIFGQDAWTLNRLTLNVGLRFDYHQAYVPAATHAAVRFLPVELSFPEVRDVPNWKDLSPRIGGALDLFGTGRTAVKASLGGYVINYFGDFSGSFDPRAAIVNSDTRNWTDRNGNFTPECDFLNSAANQECGPGSANFGKPIVSSFFDPAVLQGFGVRPYHWSFAASVQHELTSRVAMDIGYYRRWYTRHLVTENRNWEPSDFDEYCITTPVDARLPGGGGQELCGLYDITPAKFGQSDSYLTSAERFGEVREAYNGVDVSASARLENDVLLQGSVSTGRTTLNSCFVVDSPQGTGAIDENAAAGRMPEAPGLLHCDVKPPMQPRVKLVLAYPLPRGLEFSATYQSLPGTEITALYTARNAEIVSSLGRNLASGANGAVDIPLIAPGSMYGDRVNQVDMRLGWRLARGSTRFRLTLDLFNVFNENTVLAQNNTYGPEWLSPLGILSARVLKIGAQYGF